MEYLLILLVIVTNALQISGEPHPPVVINDSDKPIIVSEEENIGKVLTVLEASDDDDDNLVIRFPDFDTEAQTLVSINQTDFGPGYAAASIILKQKLDRDYSPDRRWLYFEIEDNSSNKFQIIVAIELIITDVNDEVPVFQNLPYRLELQENHVSNTIVYRNIATTDPDHGIGGKVVYSMEPITQSSKDASLFMETFVINNKTAEIFLKRPLDYEELTFFQFKIYAVDGGNLSSSEVLTIRILDIQDTAPEFQGTPYVVTILENMPMNSHFFTVRAIDGDRGIPNDVSFRFLSGPCLSFFNINAHSGEITVAGPVDRDSGDVMENGGVCELAILVSEIEQYSPQFGATTATTTMSIFVTDENDNQPYFNEVFYSAYIADTAQLNYPIQFENDTEIFVEDKDQGSSGILELVLRSQDGDITYDFEPIPSVIASRGRPLIALKSPGLLKKRTEIILKMYAIERDTSQKNSAVATINIRVLPVATTTMPSTTLRTTTPKYRDSFIPSVLGAVVAIILLIWAASVTFYLILKYKGLPRNNKVGHQNIAQGKTNVTHVQNGDSASLDISRRNDVSHA